VPASELTRAVTLNALPVNIGRAIGPALGGVLVAAAGPALVFALNVCHSSPCSSSCIAGAVQRRVPCSYRA